MSELFDSCEKDFQQYISLLQQQISHPEKYNLTNNPFEFNEAQKLLKQMEVEQMNHMNNDSIRKRVKTSKDEFDRLRRELRKIQNQKAQDLTKNRDKYDIEMEDMHSKEEQVLRENNRQLDNAKSVGLACEEIATDIKFNLSAQTHKMQNSVLKNLYEIQGETTIANRLMNIIKKERMKNKIILYSVVTFIIIAILYVFFRLIF